MRVTIGSAAAIVLLAFVAAIFWPGPSAGPGPAAALAQQPAAGAESDPPAGGLPPQAPRDKTLAEKLAQRQDFAFLETPLRDVIAVVQDQTGIQFVLNQRRLEENGVNLDTAITKNFKQVRLSTFLDLMLSDLDLVYVERDDELIVITTRDDAAATMEVRVYDCRDLLELAIIGPAVPGAIRRGRAGEGMGGGGGGGFFGSVAPGHSPDAASNGILAQVAGLGEAAEAPGGGGEPAAGGGQADGQVSAMVTEHDLRADRLIGVIVTAVDSDSWVDLGGTGSISEFGGLIVISQSARTHKKVEHVLDMLREAAGLEPGQAKKVVR